MNPKIRMRCVMIDTDVDAKDQSGTVRLERLAPDMTFDLVGVNVSAFRTGAYYDIALMIEPVAVVPAPSEKWMLSLARGPLPQPFSPPLSKPTAK
jgi:hypothetical protein